MRLVNNTSHETKTLKALMLKLFVEQGVKHNGYSVIVRRTNFVKKKEAYVLNNKVAWRVLSTKQASIRGRASYFLPKITMWLPDSFSIPCFEHVFVHEIMHTLGVRHERAGLMTCKYPSELVSKEPFLHCAEKRCSNE